MPTRSVTLTEHYDKFVSDQIASGKFRNASEVLRAGLTLLEQQMQENQEKLALLRSLVKEAQVEIEQGKGIRITTRKQLDDLIDEASQRAVKKVKSRKTAG
jgi:antitoxin ParD1/3/4